MPEACPECKSPFIGTFGLGTQKVEAAIKREFPEARVLRMDMDTTKRKHSHEKILKSFSDGEADILVGTQMIVKGHDFADVTLVGILAADLSLHANDFRAAERTFQLLTQAAGRAGRGEKAGEVVIQTYSPEHYCIVTAASQDYEEFYQQEIAYRTMLCYPPVWQMLTVLLAGPDEEVCRQTAQRLGRVIKNSGIRVIGPGEASLSKVNDIYRQVLYVKEKDYQQLVRVKERLELWIDRQELPKDLHITFDFNPMSSY